MNVDSLPSYQARDETEDETNSRLLRDAAQGTLPRDVYLALLDNITSRGIGRAKDVEYMFDARLHYEGVWDKMRKVQECVTHTNFYQLGEESRNSPVHSLQLPGESQPSPPHSDDIDFTEEEIKLLRSQGFSYFTKRNVDNFLKIYERFEHKKKFLKRVEDLDALTHDPTFLEDAKVYTDSVKFISLKISRYLGERFVALLEGGYSPSEMTTLDLLEIVRVVALILADISTPEMKNEICGKLDGVFRERYTVERLAASVTKGSVSFEEGAHTLARELWSSGDEWTMCKAAKQLSLCGNAAQTKITVIPPFVRSFAAAEKEFYKEYSTRVVEVQREMIALGHTQNTRSGISEVADECWVFETLSKTTEEYKLWLEQSRETLRKALLSKNISRERAVAYVTRLRDFFQRKYLVRCGWLKNKTTIRDGALGSLERSLKKYLDSRKDHHILDTDHYKNVLTSIRHEIAERVLQRVYRGDL